MWLLLLPSWEAYYCFVFPAQPYRKSNLALIGAPKTLLRETGLKSAVLRLFGTYVGSTLVASFHYVIVYLNGSEVPVRMRACWHFFDSQARCPVGRDCFPIDEVEPVASHSVNRLWLSVADLFWLQDAIPGSWICLLNFVSEKFCHCWFT